MEYLSVFDSLGQPTDRSVLRGDKFEKFSSNEHIGLAVIFIENDKGEFLIQKSSKEKGSYYSSTGGHINFSETPLETIKREVKEELGINIDNDHIIPIGYLLYDMPIRFIFYLNKNIDIKKIKLQEEEVESINFFKVSDIKKLIKEKKMLESHVKMFEEVLKYKEEYLDSKDVITLYKNEEYLRQVSEDVKKDDINLINDIKILEEFCKNNDVMAMAAVQLGIPKRIIYLKNTNIDLINKKMDNSETDEEKVYNEAKVLINPVVLKKEGLTEYWEACRSCGNNVGLVKRPYKIKIKYYDINHNEHTDIFKGFESTVLSHELDHLDGILHIDIADKLYIMMSEERKKLRQKEGYNIIRKTKDFKSNVENI